MEITADRRLLLVHAHPDDEVIGSGATMAKYAAEGAHVCLVTCTLGELGEVLVPELAHLAWDRDRGLGQHRMTELAGSMEALGVTDQRYLGGPGRWRDSGMMGLPDNDDPGTFLTADLDEAVAALVPVVREVRPQVLVTYNENGAYGHPDHIQAHRVAVGAMEAAADPSYRPDLGEPWTIAKLYYTSLPKSVLRQAHRMLLDAGEESPFGAVDPDELPFGDDDELVTTAIDASAYLDNKLAAMRAHATQIAVDGPFFALSNNIGQGAFGVEYFRLVRGERGPAGPEGRESDLFA